MELEIAKMKEDQIEEAGFESRAAGGRREPRHSLIYSVHRCLLQFTKPPFVVAEIAVPMQPIG